MVIIRRCGIVLACIERGQLARLIITALQDDEHVPKLLLARNAPLVSGGIRQWMGITRQCHRVADGDRRDDASRR